MSLTQLPNELFQHELACLLSFSDAVNVRKINRQYNQCFNYIHDPRLDQCALGRAVANGNIFAVKCILAIPFVDPNFNDNYALRTAGARAYQEIAQILLDDKRLNVSKKASSEILTNAVIFNRAHLVQLLLQHFDPRWDGNILICFATYFGFVDTLRVLLADQRVDPNANFNYPIIHVHGVQIASLLLNDSRVNPTVLDNEPIFHAATHCYSGIVELLMNDTRVNPSALFNRAIRVATRNGCVKTVRILLRDPRVDPSEAFIVSATSGRIKLFSILIQDSRITHSQLRLALKNASRFGRPGIVKLILRCSRSDPTSSNFSALNDAIYYHHTNVVSILLDDCRVSPEESQLYSWIHQSRGRGWYDLAAVLESYVVRKSRCIVS